MKKDTMLKILEELKESVKQRYKAEIRGVFGSYVRGEAKRGSDIDILVDFYRGASLLDLVGLSSFLEKKLKRKVDIVPRSSIRKELKKEILKEAIFL